MQKPSVERELTGAHPEAGPPVDAPETLSQADGDQATGDDLCRGHRQACRQQPAQRLKRPTMTSRQVCLQALQQLAWMKRHCMADTRAEEVRTVAGGDGDCDGGGKLGAEAAGIGDLGHLHAQAAGDVAGEQREAAHDAGAADGQDPLLHIDLYTTAAHQQSVVAQEAGACHQSVCNGPLSLNHSRHAHCTRWGHTGCVKE
jgi:hypothetical protein